MERKRNMRRSVSIAVLTMTLVVGLGAIGIVQRSVLASAQQ